MFNSIAIKAPRKIFFGALIYLLIYFNNLIAQSNYTNNWYFGNYAGLVFNLMPTALTNSAMKSFEGCATISDKSSGQLLFYTNGERIWNRNHQLFADSLFGHMSSTQSSIIIPKPDSADIYYVFTNDAIEDTLKNGFRYTIVDISLNGGLGAVRPGYLNKLDSIRYRKGNRYEARKWEGLLDCYT